MPRFARRDQRLLGELCAALDVIPGDRQLALDDLMAPFADLLRTERTLIYNVVPCGERLAVDELVMNVSGDATRAAFERFLARTEDAVDWASYNPVRPEPMQRNAVVTYDDLGPRARQVPLAQELFPRCGLDGLEQLRVLVCEGASLLAWVGAFQSESFTERQIDLLTRLVAPLRERLIVQRRLAHGPLLSAALPAALDAIAAPALLVDAEAHVVEANAAAVRWQERHGDAARRLLADAVRSARRGRREDPRFSVTQITAAGFAAHFLVIAHVNAALAEGAARAAGERWGLTARQIDVLVLLVAGHPNRVIAAELGIAERTVEVHLTAVYARAGIESRAELVSHVLTNR